MSVELANASKIIDQVASNKGYSDLIAAADEDYGDGIGAIVLRKFFERGYTTAVDSCVKTLKKLAAADGTSADVAKTAKSLAVLMDGETFVILTHGTSVGESAISESLREAAPKKKTLKRVLTVAAFSRFQHARQADQPDADHGRRRPLSGAYLKSLELARSVGHRPAVCTPQPWSHSWLARFRNWRLVSSRSAGSRTLNSCDACLMNQDAGWIPGDEDFPSRR